MTSFPLNGIARSKPNRSGANDPNAAQDGDCDEVINLRYKNSAWRPVGKKAVAVESIPFGLPTGVTVSSFFVHKLLSGTEVLAAAASDGKLYYWASGWSAAKSIATEAGEKELDSMGNVLIINNTGTDKIAWAMFSASDKEYTLINMLPKLTAQYKVTDFTQGAKIQLLEYKDVPQEPDRSQHDEYLEYLAKMEAAHKSASGKISAQINSYLKERGLVNGVLLLQCAVEMIDGSVVNHSPLTAMSSVPTPVLPVFHQNISPMMEAMYDNHIPLYGKISCKVSLIGENNKNIVKKIHIYSSRVISLFDVERPFMFLSETATQRKPKWPRVNPKVADLSFINTEPLYLLKTISPEEAGGWISLDFSEAGTGMLIPADHLSHHTLGANSVSVVNNRAMLLGAKTQLYPGFQWKDFMADGASRTQSPAVKVEMDGEKRTIAPDWSSAPASGSSSCGFILSYPDVRATKMYIKSGSAYRSVDLKPNTLLNLAYGVAEKPLGEMTDKEASIYFFSQYENEKGTTHEPTSAEDGRSSIGIIDKMMSFGFSISEVGVATTAPAPSASAAIPNARRVQLTEASAPFSYPAHLSYTLDGDVVGVAQNTIPLSTGQFGAHPLLFATTAGWRAAQLGTGDVYIAAITPINGLVPLSQRHIINANDSIVFASASGLYLMRGAEVAKISEPLEERNPPEEVVGLAATVGNAQLGSLPAEALSSVDFLDYLAGASMAYDVTENELIVTNPSYAYSYLYSVEGRLWYKVSEAYSLLAASYPKLYALSAAAGYRLLELSREEPAVQRVLLLTRALRIDQHPYKIVRKLFVNGQLHVDTAKAGGLDKYLRAGLYLSYDGGKFRMVDRKDLRGKATNVAWLASGYSGKFFKLLLCGQLLPQSCITTVDVESVEGLGA